MPEVAAAVPVAPVAPPPAAPAESEAPSAPAQNIADSAPAAAPEGEQPDKTGQDPEKRTSRRFERKIDRLHRRAAEAEARAQLYEKQLNESRTAQKPATDPSAPKIEQFSDIEEYAAAKAKYESEKTLREHTSKQQAETHKQHQARIAAEWENRVERAADKYEDWTDVVGEIQPTNPVSVAIMRAENGEDVAYHLGKNPKEAQRIIGLDPISQVFELGKLSAKLASEPPKPKTPSRAPAPISPVGGATPATNRSVYDKDLSYDDFVKLRHKQLGRK